MIPRHLLEKFGSQSFVTSIEVRQMIRHSCKPNKVWNVNIIRGGTRNVGIQNWEIYNIKQKKIIAFLKTFSWDKTVRTDKCKSTVAASVSVELALFNCY